ncbi:MAG: ABC transporter ATP-binding protein [Mogibacterium sp.]|nr:ABC transporter ATP-binding protein [Mogibacterium sp.]
MKNLFRTLIPYKWTALLVLLLMAGQAFCEMNLPQYTQALIDTGIQNRGIEHIVPEAITVSEFEEAGKLMTKDQQSLWEDSFITDAAENSSGGKEIYRRRVLTDEELEDLDVKLLAPLVTRYAAKNGETIAEAEALAGAESESIGDIEGGSAETNSNMLAMGIAYAGDCDKEAGLDLLAIQNSFMFRCGGLMLLMSVSVMIFTTFISLLAARVGASIGRDLRSRLFANVMSFSNAEMTEFRTSSLITRATNDIQQVQMTSTMMLRMMLFAPCICTWSIIKVYQTHAHMNFVIVTGVIAILLMACVMFSVAMPKFRIMQSLIDALNAVSREILTGIQVIRAFGREETEEERFDKANTDLYRNQLFVNRAMISITPILMIIMYGLSIWITWVAAGRIDTGSLQVGTMTAFIAYSMEIVFSFLMIASMAIFIPRAGIAADRVHEVLNTETSIKDNEDAAVLTSEEENGRKKGAEIKFEHVTFRYPDAEEDVLTDIDFTAKPGETTAIIGATGCGKTTLINLIPRFFDVTEGRVTIGGIDVRDIKLESLRDAIGYVPQKGILFSGTVAENIRWGDEEASDEEVRRAAEIAQAAEFIDERPEGFGREVSQGGANVSGGQKQRLAIARAVVKKPAIMLFDDSFSALDMKTDVTLRKALAEHITDSTRIIVAQRVGTILHAEQIIVLDEGRIVGKGTHKELMETCSIYRDTAISQLSEAALA